MNQKTITTLSEPETESVGQGLPVFGPVASHDTLVSVEGWLRRRYRELLITLVMFLVIFLQHPGRIVRDTKLDLSIDPGRFLGDVTHLWDAQIAFGSVPDQAYGYLFPMGPFYWLGSALHAPVWVVQRFWLALLLSVAFWGALKMAEVFRVGVPWTRLVGAAGYALSPWMLAQAHDTSYILPAVMLPWVMVPLKRAGEGTLSARSAAARSGLAVLFMGGINASLTFAVLLLPLLWFVAQSPRRRMIKLFGLWCLAVFLATAWFVLPLIFQGRYGLNFLPYTETASATTANTTVAEILRGGGIWTSYGGVPVWSTAGLLIETGQWVIVATALMAGTGLFGLARRDMPDRRFFGLSVIVGALIVCAGYNGHLGGPWAGHYQSLLNGSLALFRNVYKFQPLILLPLSLGISHALARLTVTMRGFNRSWGAPITAIFSCGVVTVLGLAAAPIFTAQIYPNGSFTSIPGYYQDAMNWLNARGAMSTTLVLPGVDFTRTTWGDPLDNPVQVLATVPWATRNVPLGSVGVTEVLDTIDRTLANGQPDPGLASFLARAGVRYIMVENDLDPELSNHPTPALVRLEVSQEPEIRRVRQFGPIVRHTNSGILADNIFDPSGVITGIRSIDIYQVESSQTSTASVTTYPAKRGVTLSGGPQGLLALADTGQLNGEAVTLSGDPLGPSFSQTAWIDADTQQLRDTTFTSLYDNTSNLLTPEEATRSGAIGNSFIVVPGMQHETVSRLSNGISVSASSFGSVFSSIPADQPLSAFLADSGGASWIARTDDPVPWIEIRFPHRIPVSAITVTPLIGPNATVVSTIRISTSAGTVIRHLAPSARRQLLTVARGKTNFLRISLLGVHKDRKGPALQAGLSHVGIPHVTVTQTFVLPADGPARTAAPSEYLFTSPIPDQFEYFRSADDEAQMNRTFTVTNRGGVFLVSGRVTPVHPPQYPSGHLNAPFSLPCGSGPTISLDGTPLQTSVSGTVEDLYALRSMQLSLCTAGAVIRLGPGIHTVMTNDPTGVFKVTALAVAGTVLPQSGPRPPRTIKVDRWTDDSRVLNVSPGSAAILNVKQNYNSGWVATVGGRTLHAVRLDGWQQGWILPASVRPQQVKLQFSPERAFRATLLVGAFLALLLVILAAIPARRRRLSGDSLGAEEPERVRRRARHVAEGPRIGAITAGCMAVVLVTFVVAGPIMAVVAACLGIVLIVFRSRSWLAWLALGAETFAGVIIALDPGYRVGVLLGSGSYTVQALGAIALMALAFSLLPDGRSRRGV